MKDQLSKVREAKEWLNNLEVIVKAARMKQSPSRQLLSDTDIFGIPTIRDVLDTIAQATPTDERVRAYKTGTWFQVETIEEMSAFYMSRLPAIREAARELGYAIGLHGSTKRDFDLIAMPWRDGFAEKDVLARAIQDAACGFSNEDYEWEDKPCGRSATSFPICWVDFAKMVSGGHIDLSVITAATSPKQDDVAERLAGFIKEERDAIFYSMTTGQHYDIGFAKERMTKQVAAFENQKGRG